jgi:hypothetical protein
MNDIAGESETPLNLSHDTGYVFDQTEADSVVPLIDGAFTGTDGYLGAQSRLSAALRAVNKRDETQVDTTRSGDVVSAPDQASTEDEGTSAEDTNPIVHELDRALMYELVVPYDGLVTCDLGHYDGDREFAWPPHIRHVTEAVADLWEYLAANTHAPGAQARFHDLSFCRGRSRFPHAVAARDAYLRFAGMRKVPDMDEAYALIRAWTLDRTFRRKDEEQAVRAAMKDALAAAWGAGEQAAGVLLPMLGALCRTRLAPEEDPVPIDDLLDRAGRTYGSTDSVRYIAELRRGRARTEEERISIARWQVEELAGVARLSKGLVRVIRLQEAISEARRFHLRDLEDALTVELQATPRDEVELEAISSTVRLSRIPYERYFRQFTRDRDWRLGIKKFAETGPPTGEWSDLVAKVDERVRRPSLMDIATTVLLDDDRLPTWQPNTDEERREYMMAREAGFHAAAAGTHLANALDRIHERYGDIALNELASFFAREGRGNFELSLVLARALRHYWAGDAEACIHIAVPRIESAARLILRELDVAIYRTQLGQRPGVYPQLAVLLDCLANLDFDESWLYFLRWLLVNHQGKNLRNEIAHGRVKGTSPADAAMVIRALLLLALLCGPGNADDIDADLTSPDAAAQAPTTSVPTRDLRQAVLRPVAHHPPFPPLRKVLAHLAVSRVTAAAKTPFDKLRHRRWHRRRAR